MGNGPSTTGTTTYVCSNNDAAGDGVPCPWYERPRQAAVTAGTINIGQGLLIVPVVRCECGSYPRDQGPPETVTELGTGRQVELGRPPRPQAPVQDTVGAWAKRAATELRKGRR